MLFILFVAVSSLICQVVHGKNTTCQILSPIDFDTGLFTANRSPDQVAKVHDNVTLFCVFKNYCSIVWYHDGIALNSSANQNASYRFAKNNQSLIIDDVMKSHHGVYKCTASNGTDSLSERLFLNVKGSISAHELAIVRTNLEKEVLEGDSLQLECDAVNYDKITWYHVDEMITPDSERVYTLKGGQVLEITEVTLGDEGRYKCVASNRTHNYSRDGFVKIDRGLCPDKEILWEGCTPRRENFYAALGSNLTINCTYSLGTARKDFTLNWYRFNGTNSANFSERSLWVNPETHVSANQGTIYNISFIPGNETRSNCTKRIYFGNILTIINVTEEAYGYYVSYGSKQGSFIYNVIQIAQEVAEPPLPVVRSRPVESSAGVLLVLSILIFSIWRRYRLDVKLFFKETRERIASNKHPHEDGLIYDVYIACCDADADVVIKSILPALQERGYRTCLRVTDFLPGGDTHSEIWQRMASSRSCLLLISNEMCQENIGLAEVQAAMNVSWPGEKDGVVPVMLEDVAESKIERYPVFKYLLKRNPRLTCRRRVLASMQQFKKSSIFKRIRLALPMPSGSRTCTVTLDPQGYIDDECTLVERDCLSLSVSSAESVETSNNMAAPHFVFHSKPKPRPVALVL